jgi:hypothetical protein
MHIVSSKACLVDQELFKYVFPRLTWLIYEQVFRCLELSKTYLANEQLFECMLLKAQSSWFSAGIEMYSFWVRHG